MIGMLTAQLNDCPPGSINICKNGDYSKWYYNDGKTSTYLAKENVNLARALVNKKYISQLLDEACYELSVIDSCIRRIETHNHRSHNFFDEASPYYNLLTETSQHSNLIYPQHHLSISQWLNEPFNTNLWHPEHLCHRTLSGHYVRSKSESMIDTSLFSYKIPFKYECELVLADGTIMYPDFTIMHPKTCKIYYWEHFGMIDNDDYSHNAFSKLEFYTHNNIYPGANLITSYETADNPLSITTIENIIRDYFF